MAEIKIQFDKDDSIMVGEVEDNQPFTLQVKKTNVEIAKGITVRQESNVIEFTNGDGKCFKIWIE